MSSHTHDFLRALPKCEHHLHIEGTLQPELAFALAKKNNITLDQERFQTLEQVKTKYENFTCLDDFLGYYDRALDVLVTEEDFEELVYQYIERAQSEGLVHGEFFFDPQSHIHRGIALETVVGGVHKAFKRAEAKWNVSFELISCFVRHLSVDDGVSTLTLLKPLIEQGLIRGIGLDSTEKNNPPLKYKAIYDLAGSWGIEVFKTVHAGEEGPPAYVRQAVDEMGITRIDHGIRVAEDEQLVDELVAKKVFLTVCPTSNVKLQCVKHVSELPLRMFIDKGLPFSLNTDDPAYFGGYLMDNYLAVHESFKLTKDEWYTLATNSIKYSWCGEERKQAVYKLIADVKDKFQDIEI